MELWVPMIVSNVVCSILFLLSFLLLYCLACSAKAASRSIAVKLSIHVMWSVVVDFEILCYCFNKEVARHVVLCQATSYYELQIGYLFTNYFHLLIKNCSGDKWDWEFLEAGSFCPKEKCPTQCTYRNVQ